MCHRTKTGVVPSFNQALRFFEDERLVFHHMVGRQTAFRLPHAHAAACGGKTHANGVRGFNAVFQPNAVGVDVHVVAAGGATAQQQFGHRNLVGHQHHLRREPRPNGVQALQPAK